jgi:hypothetical protein
MNFFIEYIDNCREIRNILREIKDANNIACKHDCIRLLELMHTVKFNIFSDILREIERVVIIPLQLMIKVKNETKNVFPNYRDVYYYCLRNRDDDDCKKWMCASKLNVDCDKMIERLDEHLIFDYNRIVDCMNNYKN